MLINDTGTSRKSEYSVLEIGAPGFSCFMFSVGVLGQFWNKDLLNYSDSQRCKTSPPFKFEGLRSIESILY